MLAVLKTLIWSVVIAPTLLPDNVSACFVVKAAI